MRWRTRGTAAHARACVTSSRRRCAPGPARVSSTSRARSTTGHCGSGGQCCRRPAPRRFDPMVGRAAHHHEPPAPRGRQDTRDAGPDDQLGGDLETGSDVTSKCRRPVQDCACLGLECGPRNDGYQVLRDVPGPDVDQMEGVVATGCLVDGVPERSRAAGLPIDSNDDRTAVSCAHRTSFRWLSPSTARWSRPRHRAQGHAGGGTFCRSAERSLPSRVTLRGLDATRRRGADARGSCGVPDSTTGSASGSGTTDTAHGADVERTRLRRCAGRSARSGCPAPDDQQVCVVASGDERLRGSRVDQERVDVSRQPPGRVSRGPPAGTRPRVRAP